MAWDWLGGTADFVTGGLTDFDGKGPGNTGWLLPKGSKSIGSQVGGMAGDFVGGGFDWKDALKSFADGYSQQDNVRGSSPTSRGSSFLDAYRPSTPSASIDMQEGGGFSGTLGNDVAFSQPGAIFLQNYPDPPVTNYYGGGSSGGSSGGSKGGSKIGSAIGGAASGFATGGIPGAIIGGIGGLFCDERVKVDIAPLETTEVNDDLAQVAFFIKGLRERS